MKGEINIVELIFVLVVLIIAFGIFFPGFVYENKWKDAYLLLTSRDLILTMDRTGKLYTNSFNRNSLSIFLDEIIPTNKTNLVAWSEAEGTVGERVIVACNCTKQQIDEMNFWFSGLKINERNVNVLFVQSSLESIPAETDVLLIRDYKRLDPYYSNFKDYAARGVGIVEMIDFSEASQVNNDQVQWEIFGLEWKEPPVGGSLEKIVFNRKPTNTSDVIYGPYKYFYHVPLPLNTSVAEAVADCDYQSSAKGTITLNNTEYPFWICSNTSVWFDVNADGIKDSLVNVRENVSIGDFNFTLSYVNDNESIALSFKPDCVFSDFLSYILQGRKIIHIEPIGDRGRVLLMGIKGRDEYPAVILNTYSNSRVAWIPNFERERKAFDEEKNLLLSLLLWASRKRSTEITHLIKTGFSTSYINVKNRDMYEVYKFSLGLAYPY